MWITPTEYWKLQLHYQRMRVFGCEAIMISNIVLSDLNPLYTNQYNLHNSTTGSIGINAESVWELASSLGSGITIAVIDGGIERNHEDLPNVFWSLKAVSVALQD